MKTIKYLSVIVLIGFMYSCFKDKGNYDYTPVNDVEIADFEKVYERITFEEILDIVPVIETKTPDDKLSFIWAISKYYSEEISGWSDRIPEIDTISRERNLSYPVELAPGPYLIYYTVNNEETGLSYYKQTQLMVNTSFTKGYYILKEVDGDSDIDLFHTRSSGDPTLADAFTILHGSPVSGKPTTFMQYTSYVFKSDPLAKDYDHAPTLNIITENDIWVVDTRTLEPIYTNETLFFGPIPPQTPIYMRDNVVGISFVSNLGYYSSYQNNDLGYNTTGKFGFPVEAPNVKLKYTVNENITSISGGQPSAFFSSGQIILFDDMNGNFMYAGFNNDLNLFNDNRATPEVEGQYPPIKPNGIEHKLIFLGANNNGPNKRAVAIFEDKDDGSTRYMYQLSIKRDNSSPVDTIIRVDPGMKLNVATELTMKERDAPIIYYLYENKVYMYDVSNNAEKILSFQGLPADETITYVGHRFYDYQKASAADIYDNLAIATYKDGRYKMHLYEHRGGEPDGAPVAVMQGKGKAFSMVFVSPDFSNNMSSCLPGARR